MINSNNYYPENNYVLTLVTANGYFQTVYELRNTGLSVGGIKFIRISMSNPHRRDVCY